MRQDLWIATDQAFKEAVETYSRKQAYLSSLARQSDIDDFSKAEPLQIIEPLVDAGLDQPQLGAGSARDFRRAAGIFRKFTNRA